MKKVKTDERSKELALKKKKEQEKREREKAEADRKKAEADAKRKAEAEAKRKAAEAAKRKAEEEARKKAEFEKAKNKYGSAFDKGKGRGDKDKAGNQGVEDGDPNSDVLTGISTGSGRVGGGLSNRGGRGPSIQENFQETGTVVSS